MRSILKLRINALAMKGIRRFGGGRLSRYLPAVFMLLPLALPVHGQSINQGLVGHWPLQDDSASTTVIAASGDDGTLAGAGNTSASSMAGPGGVHAKALTFDGTDDEVELGNQAKLNFTNTSPFTITAWVRPSAAGTRGFIFSKTTGFATDGYGLYWRGDTDKIVFTNGTSIGFPRESSAVFTDSGQWVHVAVSFDGTTATYYRNGIAAGTAGSYSFSSPTTANAKIGNRAAGSPSPDIFFDGELADVRVYDRALSQQNVEEVYILRNLTGHWPLQDNAASTTVVATAGDDGTLAGAGNTSGSSVAGPGGAQAKGLTFDGADDCVELGNQSKLNFTNTSPFTITAWVRPNGSNAAGYIFSKTNAVPPNGFGFYWRGDLDKIILTNSTALGTHHSSAVFVDDGQWVHIAACYDGNTVTYYRNGVPAGTASGYNFDTPTAANAFIGRRTAGDVSSFFEGDVADVRVYDHALSAQNLEYVYAQHYSFLAWDFTGELFDLPGAVKRAGVTGFEQTSPNNALDPDSFFQIVANATGTLTTQGYSTGTRFYADLNNPGQVLDSPVDASIRDLPNLPPPNEPRDWTPWQKDADEGTYAMVTRLAAKTRSKMLAIDFEPWTNFGATVRNNYPYNLVATSGYGANRYENQIKYDSSKPFDPADPLNPEHLDRVEDVAKMQQQFANLLVPEVIDLAYNSSHAAFGTRLCTWEWPLTVWTDFNQVLFNDRVEDWINRADATLDLRVQFPPSAAYMSGDPAATADESNEGVPRYHIPNGKVAGDYAKFNLRGPAATPTRFVDLLKLVNGRNIIGLAGQYMLQNRNTGNNPGGGAQWDDEIVRGMRRIMVYADVRGLPIAPIISPQFFESALTIHSPWEAEDGVGVNDVVVHAKLDETGASTGIDHEWRCPGGRVTGSEWDLAEQEEWIDLGRVGRGVRKEILRPIIHEMRYRYGSEWIVFISSTWYATNPIPVDDFKLFLEEELAKPVISSLADLALPEYGGDPGAQAGGLQGYPDPDDQTSIFPAGALD